jgi:glycosyltransferase involved in cell wall biosynthesis
MVRHNENGLLFLPADWDSLATQMTSMLQDPMMRSRFAAAGRKTIEESFDIRKAVKPLIKLFREAHGLPAESENPAQSIAS